MTHNLYPQKDERAVLAQCAEAHNIIGELSNPIPALVCKSWFSEKPDRVWYGFRFDPKSEHQIGDEINNSDGSYSLVVAIVK